MSFTKISPKAGFLTMLSIHNHHKLVLLLAVWTMLLGCNIQTTSLQPTREEVLEHGFRIFVLSEEITNQYGWVETFYLSSWDKHCNFADSAESYNPLTLRYSTLNEESFFVITQDPWNSLWSEGATEQIDIDKPWIKSNSLIRFLQPNNEKTATKLRFLDNNGRPVYIVSSLPESDTLNLVKALVYIRSNSRNNYDPWICQ